MDKNQIQQPDASRTAQRELHAARIAQRAEGVMAKDPKMNGPSDGGQICASDADASACLALGHPKSGTVKTAWGMKDQTADNDGPDDDARLQSFNKGKNRVL